MADDYYDFLRKESYKRDSKNEELRAREQARTEEKYQDHQRQLTRDEKKQLAAEAKEGRALVNQWEMLEVKREQALADGDAQRVATIEAEQERTKREIQIKKMDIEAKARMLKAEQDYYPEKLNIDLDHEREMSFVRSDEYARVRTIDRHNERDREDQIHRHRLEEMKAEILKMGVFHRDRKDYETHRIDEQIRFAREMAELKAEFGETMSDDEILDFINANRADWESEFD